MGLSVDSRPILLSKNVVSIFFEDLVWHLHVTSSCVVMQHHQVETPRTIHNLRKRNSWKGPLGKQNSNQETSKMFEAQGSHAVMWLAATVRICKQGCISLH